MLQAVELGSTGVHSVSLFTTRCTLDEAIRDLVSKKLDTESCLLYLT